jgi:oligopeptide/dipeptide ABC transporter ATP-binding protein
MPDSNPTTTATDESADATEPPASGTNRAEITVETDPREERVEEPLLEIRNLQLEFETHEGTVHALNGVDLDVYPGEIVGLVGETGCGKSVTARSVLGILDDNANILGGEITYRGTDLLTLSEAERRELRGDQIAMIFQEPMKSLNPAFTIEDQLTTVIERHTDRDSSAARARALELLEDLGLPDPEDVLESYPHELSGGMAQRVLIALALSCEPDLILADEPTTALDVTIQAQILDLLVDLQEKYDTSVLIITHNLGVIDRVTSRVNVMYAGSVVESGPTGRVFETPLHPYTQGLVEAIPMPGRDELSGIDGEVPDLDDPPAGCRYEPRCPVSEEHCKTYDPPMTVVSDPETPERREVRCIHYEPDQPGDPGVVLDE